MSTKRQEVAKLKRLAKEFRTDAEKYTCRPGMVGFGAQEKPIIDVCRRMAESLEAIAAAVSRPDGNIQ